MGASSRHYDSPPVVMVTGASTGIGLALARQLQHSPYRAVVTARKDSLSRFQAAGLEETSRFLIRPLDVTHLSEQESLVREIYAAWGSIDVLINNAGISFRAVLEHMTPEDLALQFQTNCFGPLNLIRLVLPQMRENRRGHIINVSSVGGMMAMPTMGAYSASKFALEGASEALWYEARPWNIQVSLIEPGFVRSNAFQKVYFTAQSRQSAQDAGSPYHFYYEYMGRFIEKLMARALTPPEKIASRVMALLLKEHAPLRVPATMDAWFFYFLRRLLPRRIYHPILYYCLPKLKSWVSR